MEENGIKESEVISLLNKAKNKDLSYEKVFSSMCTYPHPIAVKAHLKFIEANLGDPGLFQGTWELEKQVIKMLGSLLGLKNACGYITTGGTESNIQALRAFRNSSKIKNPNIIIPESAHFSFDKIADLLRIEIKKANLDEQFKVDISSVEDLIDKNTIGLVGIAGTTEFGQIDPIKELADIAISQELFLHVDAAFGGLVIPFLPKKYEFDFRVEGVTSMTADPHKMGLGTIPAGGLLFKNNYLNCLGVDTPYLTVSNSYSLTGTRSGASIAATYAVLKHLGKNGYKKIVEGCMKNTKTLVDGVKEFGIETLIEPIMNVVALKVNNAYFIKNKLKEKGWSVSITRNPTSLRLVIMPHITEENLELFIKDLKEVM